MLLFLAVPLNLLPCKWTNAIAHLERQPESYGASAVPVHAQQQQQQHADGDERDLLWAGTALFSPLQKIGQQLQSNRMSWYSRGSHSRNLAAQPVCKDHTETSTKFRKQQRCGWEWSKAEHGIIPGIGIDLDRSHREMQNTHKDKLLSVTTKWSPHAKCLEHSTATGTHRIHKSSMTSNAGEVVWPKLNHMNEESLTATHSARRTTSPVWLGAFRFALDHCLNLVDHLRSQQRNNFESLHVLHNLFMQLPMGEVSITRFKECSLN